MKRSRASVTLMGVVLLLTASVCAQEGGQVEALEPARRPVAITGPETFQNLWFPVHWPYEGLFPGNEEAPLFVPARHEDVLGIFGNEKPVFLIYAQDDGPTLHIEEIRVEDGPTGLSMNDKMVYLWLMKHEDLEWVEKAAVDELKHLRTLVLGDMDFFDEEEYEEGVQWVQGIMRKIQQAAPGVFLVILAFVPAEFVAPLRPRGLWLESLEIEKGEDGLHGVTSADPAFFQDIEYLLLPGFPEEEEEVEIVKGVLKSMPRLRYLALLGESADIEMLTALKHLRCLLLAVEDSESMESIGKMTQLQELALVVKKDGKDEEALDLSFLAPLTELRTLFLLTEAVPVKDLDFLAGMKHLTTLGLPRGTTQERFAKVIAAHPALETVHLLQEEEGGVHDLSPLKNLPNLNILAMNGDRIDPEELKELQNLKLLVALKPEVDDELVARLKEHLPECEVVVGACMGSGYALALLVPVLLAVLLRRRARR